QPLFLHPVLQRAQLDLELAQRLLVFLPRHRLVGGRHDSPFVAVSARFVARASVGPPRLASMHRRFDARQGGRSRSWRASDRARAPGNRMTASIFTILPEGTMPCAGDGVIRAGKREEGYGPWLLRLSPTLRRNVARRNVMRRNVMRRNVMRRNVMRRNVAT